MCRGRRYPPELCADFPHFVLNPPAVLPIIQKKDFIHKVGLAAKEARKSVHWLRTSIYALFVKRDISWLVDEGQQITAILTASLQTARNNRRRSDD